MRRNENDEEKKPSIGKRNVPHPLFTSNGKKITTKTEWEEIRRPEIIALFEEYVYGKAPRPESYSLRFEQTEEVTILQGKAIQRNLNIIYQGPLGEDQFQVKLLLPTEHKQPLKTILFINTRSYEQMDPEKHGHSEYWPIKYLLEQGYATASFQVSEIAPDNKEAAYERAHQIFPRSKYTWGTISAWAWGASRVLDYLETDAEIASDQVAVVGHSRGGKAALWAGALDERFNLVVSNNSGSTGAAIARGKTGETIKDINTGFPYWFTEKYKTFNDHEEELPVDQHLLIGVIVPRFVYVTSATKDDWADPASEFLSLVYTKPVYQLFGLSHNKINQLPQPDRPIFEEAVGYHLRTGKHDLTLYDWKNIIRFWEKSSH